MRTIHCLEMGQSSKKGKNGDGHTQICNLREKAQYLGPSFHLKRKFHSR